eukprot:5435229-Pyramimonas_sp.AAC.2
MQRLAHLFDRRCSGLYSRELVRMQQHCVVTRHSTQPPHLAPPILIMRLTIVPLMRVRSIAPPMSSERNASASDASSVPGRSIDFAFLTVAPTMAGT